MLQEGKTFTGLSDALQATIPCQRMQLLLLCRKRFTGVGSRARLVCRASFLGIQHRGRVVMHTASDKGATPSASEWVHNPCLATAADAGIPCLFAANAGAVLNLRCVPRLARRSQLNWRDDLSAWKLPASEASETPGMAIHWRAS